MTSVVIVGPSAHDGSFPISGLSEANVAVNVVPGDGVTAERVADMAVGVAFKVGEAVDRGEMCFET